MLPVRRRRPPRAAVHAPAQGEAVPPLRILRAPVARLPARPLLQLLQDRTQERELPGGEGRGAGRAGAESQDVRQVRRTGPRRQGVRSRRRRHESARVRVLPVRGGRAPREGVPQR
ncbi:predicted protein, partial [Micromonas commoda]